MSIGATAFAGQRTQCEPATALAALPLRFLHALINAPATIYLLALTAMLFRPPDLKSVPVDRIAFVALLCVLALRACISREKFRTFPATWPMLALLALGLWGVLAQPYESQAWSLLAAKWIIPVALFHMAGMAFRDESALRKLEIFSLAILFYLAAISVLTLFDATSLIFPRFILDESLGIHADRARGPFLQAVANGVCLNILGLIALHSYARHRLPRLGSVLFFAVPLALLATRTRAVWLSAAFSVWCFTVFPFGNRLRRVGLALCIMGGAGASAAWLYQIGSEDLSARLEDRSPLEFRLEMYRSGLQMFAEKPLMGWGSEATVQPEIAKRMSNFHPERYLFHNTYLELAVERGVLGLGLYAWLMVCFFRLGKWRNPANESDQRFLGAQFRPLWIVIVGVYLLNASAVVMNYQFVNGYLFTLAGILSAQDAIDRRRIA